jgi:hypothetical protein
VSARIGSALLVAGVAEAHQLPDRVVLVDLDRLTASIPGDLDCTAEAGSFGNAGKVGSAIPQEMDRKPSTNPQESRPA